MTQANRFTAAFAAIFFLALLPSCSGSGDSGSDADPRIGLSPLVLPEQVSVVDPQETGSGKPRAGTNRDIPPLVLGVLPGDLSPDSDYLNDRVSVYVNERSLETFDSVNEILCMLDQSRYYDMLNMGPYRVQVDKNLCSTNRSDASSAGQSSTDQSSGASRPNYEEWVVDSSRTNAQSPHLVKAWIHSQPDDPYEPPTIIYAKIVITEGADTAPPYGIFSTNFKAYMPPDLSTIFFKGFLNAEEDPQTGTILLKFSTEDKDSYVIEKATLDKSTDGSTGAGSVFTAESYPGITPSATRYNLAYNTTNFLRSDNTGSSVCLDRKAYDVSTWKYALYSTETPTGQRIKVNSGFTVNVGTTYGWVGYYGAWFPSGVTVNDGDPVYKHDYATNADTPYTLVKRGGKLKRHKRNLITLDEIKNIPLIWWDETGNAFQVKWTGSVFTKISMQNPPPDYTWASCASAPCGTPDIDLTVLPWVELSFWSQSLGGFTLVRFPAPGAASPLTATCTVNISPASTFDCTPAATDPQAGSTEVDVYEENIVYPTDPVPTTLACFDNCPNIVTLTTATPFFPQNAIASYQSVTPEFSTYASYNFDAAGLILTDTETSLPIVADTTDAAFENGITSGPLFDPALLTAPSTTIPSPLGCDWAPFSQTCGGKAWTALPVFYTWETGPNEWNQFTGLEDAGGALIRFDPPLQVEYVHSQPSASAPDYIYNGTTFYLDYAGFGDLQGIPGMCVNLDTGESNVDCNDGATDKAIRWVPEFNIPPVDASGNVTEVADVLNPGTTYFIKALEKEERMKSASMAACSGLTVDAYTLPSMSSWINPLIGPEPIVNAPPAVIGGVLQ